MPTCKTIKLIGAFVGWLSEEPLKKLTFSYISALAVSSSGPPGVWLSWLQPPLSSVASARAQRR